MTDDQAPQSRAVDAAHSRLGQRIRPDHCGWRQPLLTTATNDAGAERVAARRARRITQQRLQLAIAADRLVEQAQRLKTRIALWCDLLSEQAELRLGVTYEDPTHADDPDHDEAVDRLDDVTELLAGLHQLRHAMRYGNRPAHRDARPQIYPTSPPYGDTRGGAR